MFLSITILRGYEYDNLSASSNEIKDFEAWIQKIGIISTTCTYVINT